MAFIMVDVETDGPIPGEYSMISVGAIRVQKDLESAPTFSVKLRPISDLWIPDALAVSGHTREETLSFDDPAEAMGRFEAWVKEVGGERPRFISDNNGFDWMFVCWYFHRFLGRNPFGHSSTNLGSLYKGLEASMYVNFKHLRWTKHTHDPLDDARGNAEVMMAMGERIQGIIIGCSSAS